MELLREILIQNLLSFLHLSAVVAFVSTAIRYDEWPVILQRGGKYFLFIVLGVGALIGIIAGLEYGFHW